MKIFKNSKSLVILMFFVLFFPYTNTAHAMPTQDEISYEITDELSGEYIECLNFYNIVSEGGRRAGNQKIVDGADSAAKEAFEYAVLYTSNERSEEMALKVFSARSELSLKSMADSIDGDMKNLSILTSKYGAKCKSLVENPDAAYLNYSKKVLDKHLPK